MIVVFYLSAIVAIVSTILVLSSNAPMHALLYLIVSLLAVALIFFTLGAPFVAALEVIVYAGAIMVLFLFVVMMLNAPRQVDEQRRISVSLQGWIGPVVLALILLAELIYVLSQGRMQPALVAAIEPRQVGAALFGPYLLGVELASLVLLAGLVGAFHLGQRSEPGGDATGGGK
jgi:NADH-quinone oxidoreductase subunit J